MCAHDFGLNIMESQMAYQSVSRAVITLRINSGQYAGPYNYS